ncbi:CARDB protein [Anaerovirgula multivorans]|uniref:CARDB protein n=1 Tax=Anaerovirgula multivorans TaxID=312168 RepID=A0A239JUE3_9FIRM|nr:CARDB domain-containing protein [Anaerovirgula multivorans]SNT09481.1 CARDB protein [Anaerovirgula multivorans]
MKRKLFCLLMICGIISMIFQPLYSYAEYNEPANVQEPHLVIGRDYKMPVFKAGTEVRLAIPIQNTTNGEAVDVFVSPVIEDTKEFPFEIDRMVTDRKVSSIDSRGTETAAFYLNVKKNAEAKTYAIKLNVQYSSRNGGNYSLSETIYIKIENEYKAPSLSLMDTKVDSGKLLSGSARTVGFTIKNSGDLDAEEVKIRLGGFSGSGLFLDSPQDTVDIQTLPAGGDRIVYFNVEAGENLDSGTYSLDLFITYKDEYNVPYEVETKVYLPVEEVGSGQTTFVFENLIYPQEAVKPYTDFNIKFDLKNIGSQNVNNLKISVDAGEEVLPKTMSVKNIDSLVAGKSVPLEFTMFAKENIESKNYPIKVSVEYETGGGSKKETQVINQYVGVFVDSNDRESVTPKLVIDRYDYGGEFVKAGESFPLTISFYNTNRNHDVRNIRVSLTSDGDIFSPVNGSNSFYIQEIPPNGKVEKTISLRPKIDATYKTHNIFAEIEYEDTKGKDYSTKELMGIPVIQEANLVMGEIALSNENFVGIPIPLSLEFYNAGRGLIRNMMISIEGNFDTNEGSLYIGDLEAGKNNYYDVTIVPTALGTLQGKIIFEYDDEIDQHFIIEREVTLEVMEQMEPPMPEPFMELDNTNSPSSKMKIAIGIGGVILLAVAAFIYYKRRKKKLEEVDFYE